MRTSAGRRAHPDEAQVPPGANRGKERLCSKHKAYERAARLADHLIPKWSSAIVGQHLSRWSASEPLVSI